LIDDRVFGLMSDLGRFSTGEAIRAAVFQKAPTATDYDFRFISDKESLPFYGAGTVNPVGLRSDNQSIHVFISEEEIRARLTGFEVDNSTKQG
jgi:hypothetical protein